ncbi:MAG: hypothetical protein HKO79_12475 [Desulfobacterales bacterium]|nr:hypothetical protein [Desulfobacterales bacterium]
MDRIRAAFDLDGVLANSLDIILDSLTSLGYLPKLNDRNEFHFNFQKGLAPPKDFLWDVFFYRLFTERFDEITLVDDYSVDFLNEIYAFTNEPIRIITARPSGALMHHATMTWLDRNYPDVSFSVDVVGSGSVKHQYMYDKSMIFEDRRKTSVSMALLGYDVFMINTDYNRLDDLEYWPEHLRTFDSFEDLLFDDVTMELICPGCRS